MTEARNANGQSKPAPNSSTNLTKPSVATTSTPSQAAPNSASSSPSLAEIRQNPELIAKSFRSGDFPYTKKISGKDYEAQKRALQIELLKVQKWVKESGERVVILFEGRDAAGKGGTIKRFMEHLNPRGAREQHLKNQAKRKADNGITNATSSTYLLLVK